MDHQESHCTSLQLHPFRKSLMVGTLILIKRCWGIRKAASWQHRSKVTWSSEDNNMLVAQERQWQLQIQVKTTSQDWVWIINIIPACRNQLWQRHEKTLVWWWKTQRQVKDNTECNNNRCLRCQILLALHWLRRQRLVVTLKFKLIIPSPSTMCTSRSSPNEPAWTSRRSLSRSRRVTCATKRRCCSKREAKVTA